MCTAIAFKGRDLLYGFNLDIDPAVWHFSVRKNKNLFAVAITAGKTDYYVHGVNRNGQFGNTPYMNADPPAPPRGVRRERIDLMNDRYIRGKYSYDDILKILRTGAVTCVPAAAMHSLMGNADGDVLIVEPGSGYKTVHGCAVLANFPVLTPPADYANPFYGKDRYDKALAVLSRADADFSVSDALRLLAGTVQHGQWATRVSFAYSRNENAVYWFENGDISTVRRHAFE